VLERSTRSSTHDGFGACMEVAVASAAHEMDTGGLHVQAVVVDESSIRRLARMLHMDIKKLGKFTEPGHAVTGDRTKRSRRVGWEYCHSIVDDCSRLAYSELHDDERADTVTAFTTRALDFFLEHGIVAERLMTDNAFAYVNSRSLRQLLHRRAIRHVRTKPYTPQTNGKVERYQQTLQRECAYALEYASSEARRTSATLGASLQRAAHPQRPRQPNAPHPRSGGHRAQQLAGK
jgi:transposase InsO family protein